jgi:hypothetical protein
MTDWNEVVDRLIDSLKAKQDARLESEQQSSADAADQSKAADLAAYRARQFVSELVELATKVSGRLGPELGRPVPIHIEQLLNPFHGDHHDYRTAIRVSKRELYMNACMGVVSIERRDVGTGTRVSRLVLKGFDLMPAHRTETVARTLKEFLEDSVD